MPLRVWTKLGVINVARCCKCDTLFSLDDETLEVAHARKKEFSFCCPHGHWQHFRDDYVEKKKGIKKSNELIEKIGNVITFPKGE